MTTTSRVYYPQNARRHVENVRDTSNAILKRARLADQLQFLAALHPDEFARGSVLEIVVIVPQDPSCELSKRVQRRLQELYSPFPLYALTYGYPRELCPLFSETEVPSFGILPSAPLKLASLVPALSKQPTGAREGRGIDEDGQEPGRVDPPFGSVQPTNSHSTFQSCVHLFKSTEQRELLQELRVRADIETEVRNYAPSYVRWSHTVQVERRRELVDLRDHLQRPVIFLESCVLLLHPVQRHSPARPQGSPRRREQRLFQSDSASSSIYSKQRTSSEIFQGPSKSI